jgi:hypothetical protein
MCAEEFKAIVDSSFDKGTPLWIHTNDYIYGIVPRDNNRWLEVSYTFDDPDEPLVKAEKGADITFQLMLEELTKGVSFYVEDLNVTNLKDFAKSIETKPGSDKIIALIAELINNTENYSSNLPIIKSKDALGTLKGKL